MATIHVARGGTNIGTFSVEEIRDGLSTGRFFPTDMAWKAGMSDWRPLAQIMAEKPGAAAPTADPAQAAVLPQPAGAGLPWENREQLGLFKAYFDTVSLLLTKPGEAFAIMKPEGGLAGPLFFALIGGGAGLIVSFLVQAGMRSVGFMRGGQSDLFGTEMGIVWGVILMPLIFLCGLFLWSGIVHLCLMMLGGAKKPFETTFRVVCFSSGSAYLLAIIPFCGRVVAPVYNIVLQCIGLARAQETDTGKAVMAVLLPLIVCCGGGILIGILGGFGALSWFSRH